MDFSVNENLPHALRAQNMTCIRGDRAIFSNLEFELPPGRALILNGANGSGKSSLLKIVAGLLQAQNGALFFDHQDILGDQDWISHNICYLDHNNGMKPEMTVAENLIFWAEMAHHHEDVRTAASKVGIDHCLDLPVCYLSSGQARRAAITRVLCHPGQIWLLDEPTVGLDREGVALLAGLMNEHLTQGGRILTATHIELDIDPAKYAILNMSDFAPAISSAYGEDLLC